jgi:tRNA/tmRNA/rRNA uracil-C5-methylase (TrmA/RlmC/RlmD family)
VASLSAAGRRFDCVIVDAPRAGAEFDLGRLVELGARVVILCSCYAPSFARDLERLRRAGYAVEELVAFDMFPQTHHLESAALLVRGSAQG